MSAKKAKSNLKLSSELNGVVENLVSASSKQGSLTEDDIQIAIKDIDVDGDELSDLYDSIRAHGIDITTAGEASMPSMAASTALRIAPEPMTSITGALSGASAITSPPGALAV